MRRRKRGDDSHRAREARSFGSLMYYLDLHEEARASAEAHARTSALVHNVVGTARIAVTPGPLDLRLVNTLLPNSCFVKKKFAAITVRLSEPTCTILLFGSGKCVLTGCRDFVSCIRAMYDVLDLLRRHMHGVHFSVETIQMQNIVGHADMELVGAHVDLARFYADHNIECTFQRSMFPGLVFRSSQSNVVLLVFRSGRIVLTGGRDISCLNIAWRRMLPELRRYVVCDDAQQTEPTRVGSARAESAGEATAVYCAAVCGGDEAGARSRGRVDSDVPAQRNGARGGGGSRRGVAAGAREAAAEPPHDGGA
jgi:transcription initiation factor TFIID TATA-box-binding protein